MIRIQQLKLPITHTQEALEHKIAKTLRIPWSEVVSFNITRQSVDARKKSDVSYVYTIDAVVLDEQRAISRSRSTQVFVATENTYQFYMPTVSEGNLSVDTAGLEALQTRPVVIGSGPAGLFCAWMLAKHGFAPLILERGKKVTERTKDVEAFWESNVLLPNSNVQFGEGGAGTFSDGKLNTLVKDVRGRNQKVLEIFIGAGAPKSIGYTSKPHLGTDVLVGIAAEMRRQIELWGGTYLFETCMKNLEFSGNRLTAVICEDLTDNTVKRIETQTAVLAIGHSARDTFEMLEQKQIPMEAKAFAVGLRVEHPQSVISEHQYGKEAALVLPPASYKLTATLPNGRGIYSFCMCPGGFVVNTSSEEKRLAVNGMSYSKRDGKNANSAIIVTVTPEDFDTKGPLSGVRFQQKLEEKAWELGAGMIPQQLFGDFVQQKISSQYGSFSSELKGQHTFGALHELFGADLAASFTEGMHQFSKYIKDFDRPDAILSGVESRTSSPVRILRNEQFESSFQGIYPCGEGAGYAGGIMSAAMDGLKVAEAIAKKYRPII